jgi:L-threonylcarbamoyladenylate synthase
MTPWHLRRAARAIRRGGIVACPTEGVFGLHCDPLDPGAVERVWELKGRPAGKGLILLAGHLEQLQGYMDLSEPRSRKRLEATWPGPVTWIVPATAATPAWLTGGRATIAVRVTDHPVAAALCSACGFALVSTSANISGHPPARDALTVQRVFGHALDYILHAPTGGLRGPTEVRVLATGQILRSG